MPRRSTPPAPPEPTPTARRSRVDPRIATALNVKRVPIAELRQWDDNPHTGDDETLRASIRRFGQVVPIVRAPDGWIISGNTTLRAMDAEGFVDCAVVTLDAEQAEQVAFALTANRTAQLGTDNEQQVLRLLESIGAIEGTGYVDDDLADFRARLQEAEEATPAAPFFNPDTGIRDGNHSMAEHLDHYAGHTVRAVILNFQLPVFQWVNEQAAVARERLGVETNAQLLVKLLAAYTGAAAPEVETGE